MLFRSLDAIVVDGPLPGVGPRTDEGVLIDGTWFSDTTEIDIAERHARRLLALVRHRRNQVEALESILLSIPWNADPEINAHRLVERGVRVGDA